MGIFALRMIMIFMAMEHLNEGVYKTQAASRTELYLQATAHDVTSSTKAVRIVSRLTWLYPEKNS